MRKTEVINQRTHNKMTKGKMTNRQTKVHKTPQRELTMKQHEPY